MKKSITISVACILAAASFTGCSSENSADSSASAAKSGVVLTSLTDADFDETASTLEELEEKADFIAKIKVTDTSVFLYPDTDMICTKITPEILELYKGTYQNESLELNGGQLSYAEYTAQIETDAFDVSAYSQEELNTAQVYNRFCNVSVPQVGDILLYFGVSSEDGNYQVAYDYQGIFQLEDGYYVNQALIVQENDWQEPLVTDLLDNTNAEITEAPTAKTQTVDGIEYTYPESDYTSVLAVPEDAMTAAFA